jgi:hypothetical protein
MLWRGVLTIVAGSALNVPDGEKDCCSSCLLSWTNAEDTSAADSEIIWVWGEEKAIVKTL